MEQIIKEFLDKHFGYQENSLTEDLLDLLDPIMEIKSNEDYQQGYTDGYSKGSDEGYDEGYNNGYNDGYSDGSL